MAPVIKLLLNEKSIVLKVCITAQHREMLDQVLELFSIKPDFDLDIMTSGQNLFDLTSNLLLVLGELLAEEKPNLILIHGDTTSCFSAALAAFYRNIPIAHIEAGLRTNNLRAPFPEEANRSLVSKLALLHFAPTENAYQNLIKENIAEKNIWITGNTVIDALLQVKKDNKKLPQLFWKNHFGEELYHQILDKKRKLILITGHRRENFGQGFIDLCNAIKTMAIKHEHWDFVYPVHLNPNVQKPVFLILGDLQNVHLISPQEYSTFVWLMTFSELILTDSGGIQEEAPALGKPVFVMRNETERPEAVEAGTVKLVGTAQGAIVRSVEEILTDKKIYSKMAFAHNPYGDGKAAIRIKDTIMEQIHKGIVL